MWQRANAQTFVTILTDSATRVDIPHRLRRLRDMDRRDVVELFRERLLKVIADSGMTRTKRSSAYRCA